jgi:hypothetical protein
MPGSRNQIVSSLERGDLADPEDQD